jgi:hypothetical protein
MRRKLGMVRLYANDGSRRRSSLGRTSCVMTLFRVLSPYASLALRDCALDAAATLRTDAGFGTRAAHGTHSAITPYRQIAVSEFGADRRGRFHPGAG